MVGVLVLELSCLKSNCRRFYGHGQKFKTTIKKMYFFPSECSEVIASEVKWHELVILTSAYCSRFSIDQPSVNTSFCCILQVLVCMVDLMIKKRLEGGW